MNPYFTKGATCLSFSGGRTSAYMLYKTLEAHDGVLPDETFVAFANTGMEHPATLDFVRDCGEQWGVDIVWLEATTRLGGDGENKFVYGYRFVDHATASRNGEPFAELIAARGYPPNRLVRYCTGQLKIKRIMQFMRDKGHPDYTALVGLRADEPRRAVRMHGQKKEGHDCWCPMYIDGVTKQTVSDFWQQQNFDLNLPNRNGVTDLGNCTLCFLKGRNKKISIIRQQPDLADWWIEQEKKVNKPFRVDDPDYATMKIIATTQTDMFGDSDEENAIDCFCTE